MFFSVGLCFFRISCSLVCVSRFLFVSDFVSSVLAHRLPKKSASEMTHIVSIGTQNINPVYNAYIISVTAMRQVNLH